MTEEGSLFEDTLDEHATSPRHPHVFDLNFTYTDWITLGPKRIKLAENSDSEQPEDADYSPFESLNHDLENRIFARFPRSEYWKIPFLSKRFLALYNSGDLYKIRKEIGFKEPSVFMFASGETSWWAFDREFKSRVRLPILPSDPCFAAGDKESICAGTHLLVSGKEIDGLVVWRYELDKNEWFKGPAMINPRCLFASATCTAGCAYVAGGMGSASRKTEVYDTAERYDPELGSWDPLPRMRRKRMFCAGFYMDGRFYVIGGRNGDGELTCGEFFDESRNKWELIPNMLKDDPVQSSRSPPLLAVVNNELYSLEASSNQLNVYVKKTNTWRQMGPVPVRADSNGGWGVAFKSLGNELLVIGASHDGNHMGIYTCCPDTESGQLEWKKPIDSGKNRLSHFIWNCSVMVA